MRIYLDVCCLCRPFDDQSQDRIRLETEAIITLLKHCQLGGWVFAASRAIDYEFSAIDLNNPSLIRQKGIEALTDALGPLGMVKFMQQFGGRTGDYTKERKELLAGTTMDDFKRWCEEKDKGEGQ